MRTPAILLATMVLSQPALAQSESAGDASPGQVAPNGQSSASAAAGPHAEAASGAQESPEVSSPQENQNGEIIVTAQRRAQSVLTVPLSIQATSGEQLTKIGIKDLTSLQFTTPGYITQTNSGFTQIYLRGIGNSIFLGADPSVATFVDDVPRIYGSTTDNFFDVERVEVLKGAQGGLYGRNATGGVVNIITRQPSTERFESNFLGSYGEKNTLRVAGYVNVPLSDKIAISLAAERDTHNSYVRNLAIRNPYSAANFPGGAPAFGLNPQQTADFFNEATAHPKQQDQDFYAVQAKILLKPVENIRIVLAGDYNNKDDNTGSDQDNLIPSLTQAAVSGYFGALGITTNLPAGFVKGGNGKFTNAVGFPETTPVRDYGVSATITWNGPGFDLTSITAYRHQHTLFISDVNQASVPTIPLNVEFNKRFYYQELRALSTFNGPLRLIGGFTYLDNRLTGGNKIFLLSPAIPLSQTQADDHIKNYSIYGQAEYAITDALTVIASARYQNETNHVQFTQPVVSSGQAKEHKITPAVTINYKVEDGTIFARWARGFKTGGINIATAPSNFPRPQDGSVFGPETVDTYEVGVKKGLLDRRLQMTLVGFYNDYRGLQVDAINRPAFPAVTTAIVNAKSARTYGVEASVSWHVIDPLTIGFNAGYLNARYKDFELVGSTVLQDFNQSGQRMPKAPSFQGSLNVDLDQPISSRFRLVSNLLVSHTSKFFFEVSGAPGVIPAAGQSGYWLANGRIGLRTTDDRYGLALVADNIFNKGYFVFGQSALTGVTSGWGNPRIIRGEFTAKF